MCIYNNIFEYLEWVLIQLYITKILICILIYLSDADVQHRWPRRPYWIHVNSILVQ